jgi:hypothetical protein
VVRGTGEEAQKSPLPEMLPVTLRLDGPVQVRMSTKEGLGVVPPEVELAPGDRSHGLRVIDEKYEKGVFSVVLEGRAGKSCKFRVRTFDREIGSALGCTLLSIKPGIQTFQVGFPPSRADYVRKEVKLVMVGMMYDPDKHGAVPTDGKFDVQTRR